MEKKKTVRFILIAALIVVLGAVAAGAVYASRRAERPARSAQVEDGVLVAAVEAGGPAEAAGVVRGDILLEVNEQAVNSVADVRAILDELEAGAVVTLKVQHGDEQRILSATLDENKQLGIWPCGGADMGPGAHRVTIRQEPGALVKEVVAGGPAEAAGLQVDDLIVAVNGEPLAAGESLADRLAAFSPGDTVTLELQRDGEALSLSATLGEHPDKAGAPYLGVSVLPAGAFIINEDREIHIVPGRPGAGGRLLGAGVVVLEVTAGSPAEKAGLQPDDVILAVDGQELGVEGDLAGRIGEREPGDTVTLEVERGGETLELAVELGAAEGDAERAWLGVSYRPAAVHYEMGELPGRGDLGGWLELRPGGTWTDLEGVLVMAVAAGSPAEQAGIKAGDVISAVDGETIATLDDLDMANRTAGDELTLTVTTPGEGARELVVTLAANDDGQAWLGIQAGPSLRFHRGPGGSDGSGPLGMDQLHQWFDDNLNAPPFRFRDQQEVPGTTL